MKIFFEPGPLALIGVTRQTGPGAFNNLEMLQRYGYSGKIYLVHPQVQEILDKKPLPGWPTCLRPPSWPSFPWAGIGSCRFSGIASSGALEG